jgi:hypothetical protein
MGHTGKHIIDPETGLCVICDQDAIQEVTQGRRPGKQYYYANGNDGSTYRSYNDEAPYAKDRYVYETGDEQRPRYIRKTVYPAPTVRPRRVLYEQPIEEPIVIRRKVIRRDPSPTEQVILHHPSPPRPTKVYYVDPDNQVIPQNKPLPEEPPRRYVIRKRNPPPERTVHVIRQTTPPPVRKVPVIRQPARTPTPPARVVHVTRPPPQTPPPPVSEPWHTVPRRETNSDTQIVERQQRIRHEDRYPSPPPIKAEMYYIEAATDRNPQSPLELPIFTSRSPTPKPTYQGDRNRKPNRIEPLERQPPPPHEPTVIKRVYKRPPGSNKPPADDFGPNENQPYRTRRPGNYTPPPKQYQSSPRYNNGNPEPSNNPAIFYIRNTDGYE